MEPIPVLLAALAVAVLVLLVAVTRMAESQRRMARQVSRMASALASLPPGTPVPQVPGAKPAGPNYSDGKMTWTRAGLAWAVLTVALCIFIAGAIFWSLYSSVQP